MTTTVFLIIKQKYLITSQQDHLIYVRLFRLYTVVFCIVCSTPFSIYVFLTLFSLLYYFPRWLRSEWLDCGGRLDQLLLLLLSKQIRCRHFKVTENHESTWKSEIFDVFTTFSSFLLCIRDNTDNRGQKPIKSNPTKCSNKKRMRFLCVCFI